MQATAAAGSGSPLVARPVEREEEPTEPRRRSFNPDPAAGQPNQQAPATRAVFINGVPLSDEEVRAIERRSWVRLMDGDYWYDRRSGAWGFRGGPAVGVVAAGLELGGPLAADASNGTTGVYVNGRQLHVQEVMLLQRVLPMVLPGRYWMDAGGKFGYENGFPVGNIWGMAAAAGAPRQGVLSTYDKRASRSSARRPHEVAPPGAPATLQAHPHHFRPTDTCTPAAGLTSS